MTWLLVIATIHGDIIRTDRRFKSAAKCQSEAHYWNMTIQPARGDATFACAMEKTK